MGDFDFVDSVSPTPTRRPVAKKRTRKAGAASTATAAVAVVVAMFVAGVGSMVFMRLHTGQVMEQIEQDVLADCVERYAAVARGGGSHLELSAHAQMVMGAAAQAKDDKEYAKWRRVYVRHCRAAGISVMP